MLTLHYEVSLIIVFVNIIHNICLLGHNHRVYVLDDNQWSVKGRYDVVIADDEKCTWVKEKEKLVTHILLVSD